MNSVILSLGVMTIGVILIFVIKLYFNDKISDSYEDNMDKQEKIFRKVRINVKRAVQEQDRVEVIRQGTLDDFGRFEYLYILKFRQPKSYTIDELENKLKRIDTTVVYDWNWFIATTATDNRKGHTGYIYINLEEALFAL